MNEPTKSDEKVDKPSSHFGEPHEVVEILPCRKPARSKRSMRWSRMPVSWRKPRRRACPEASATSFMRCSSPRRRSTCRGPYDDAKRSADGSIGRRSLAGHPAWPYALRSWHKSRALRCCGTGPLGVLHGMIAV